MDYELGKDMEQMKRNIERIEAKIDFLLKAQEDLYADTGGSDGARKD
jgi:hypothetical protein